MFWCIQNNLNITTQHKQIPNFMIPLVGCSSFWYVGREKVEIQTAFCICALLCSSPARLLTTGQYSWCWCWRVEVSSYFSADNSISFSQKNMVVINFVIFVSWRWDTRWHILSRLRPRCGGEVWKSLTCVCKLINGNMDNFQRQTFSFT